MLSTRSRHVVRVRSRRSALTTDRNVPDDAIDEILVEVVNAASGAPPPPRVPATPVVTQRRTAAIL